MNLHSLSEGVSELLEYRRKCVDFRGRKTGVPGEKTLEVQERRTTRNSTANLSHQPTGGVDQTLLVFLQANSKRGCV